MYYWYIADLLENYWALGHVSWDGNADSQCTCLSEEGHAGNSFTKLIGLQSWGSQIFINVDHNNSLLITGQLIDCPEK